MHILGTISFLFLVCLYLFSLEAYFILCLVLAVWGLILTKRNKKLILIIFLCPLLAFISLNFYEDYGTVRELRVVKIYDRYLIANKGFKRFQVKGDINQYQVGDILLGDVKIEKLSRNPSGYLATVTLASPQRKKDLLSKARAYRETLTRKVLHEYGFDRGSLMASLVLGYKEEMNRERQDAMKTMGIMHILSISGFHFALLDLALKKMRLGKIRFYCLGIYALFIDSISGYRTILTLFYKMIGLGVKKDADMVTGLFLAMFIQAFLSPYLIFQTGYLLTYLSTLGILVFHDTIRRKLSPLPSLLRDSLSLTLAALSLSFPVILTFSPDFSLGVFAGNMILVPLYVITTYLSFIGIMVMNIPWLKFVILPFIEVFFDLSYFMGSFLSHFALKMSLENLLAFYVPILMALLVIIYKKSYKGIIVMIVLLCLIEMPLGSSLTIYNRYGRPSIRITQNLKNYDIMDYRVADKEAISLREDQEFNLGEHLVELQLREKKSEVPRILINGNELRLDRTFEYYRGSRQERKYLFINERIMRIK